VWNKKDQLSDQFAPEKFKIIFGNRVGFFDNSSFSCSEKNAIFLNPFQYEGQITILFTKDNIGKNEVRFQYRLSESGLASKLKDDASIDLSNEYENVKIALTNFHTQTFKQSKELFQNMVFMANMIGDEMEIPKEVEVPKEISKNFFIVNKKALVAEEKLENRTLGFIQRKFPKRKSLLSIVKM
jgi:hypothetical protein